MRPPNLAVPFLSPFKIGAPAIAKRTDCKVNPDDVRFLFYQQLIEILLVQITDVEQ